MDQEMWTRVDQLASYIGTKSEVLWEVLVRRGLAEGVADLVSVPVALFVAYWFYRGVRWGKSLMESKQYPEPEHVLVIGFGSVGVGVSVVMAASYLRSGIIYLISPDFYAIDKLIEILK